MCRFTLYLGQPIRLDQLITEPVNSLIHQSFQSQEREEPLNGDGFGVAWYAPDVGPQPAVFRSVSPAWSNRNLLEVARVTRSPCVLAHVRAATPGSAVAETNCHPFVHGNLAFMHNGTLGGFARARRALLERLSDDAFQAIEGTTDSEHLFALFLDRWRQQDTGDGAARMVRALMAAIGEALTLSEMLGIDEPSYLNIAVSDGHHAVVTRLTTDEPQNAESLYYSVGQRYTQVGDHTELRQPDVGRGAVMVSSEPLSGDDSWRGVPPNHVVLVRSERDVQVEELTVRSA